MLHKTGLTSSRAARSRRGAIGKGCLIGAVLLGGILLVVGFGIAKYNALVGGQTGVQAKWSEIDNQYQRRYDVIPQLVETVKGAANFEQATLTQVIEARASVGRVQLPSTLPTDPAQVQAYIQAQNQLGGALGRLFAVAEQYPELKASQNFLSLQDQIEGTENRIATARSDYIDAAGAYNRDTRVFPGNLVANLFDFEPVAMIEATPEQRERPDIDFGDFRGTTKQE